jgi:nicotinamidase-related amidase
MQRPDPYMATSQSGSRTPEITLDPKRTAVLILHMMNEQLKYKPGISHHGPEFAEVNKKSGIVEHTKAVLDASRDRGVLVIYVRLAYRPGHPEIPPTEELIPGRRPTREKEQYREGSWNTQIVNELKPTGSDIVVTNHTPSAFAHNELDAILHANNIRYLVIAGLSTKTIVTCTTIDAYCRGYYNYILKDCCNSRKEGEHELYVKEVLPSYAVIIDSKQYLSALRKMMK